MQLSWLKKYNLLMFDEIDSTNSEGMRLAKSGVRGDFVIWAKSQTMGRGRYGKTWQSDPGNLYISILLDNNISISKQPQISFISGLALHDAISAIFKKQPKNFEMFLKWPNDILIDDKKVAGILLESVTVNGRNYLIVGIGVNIYFSPKNTGQSTTDLLSEGIITDSDKLLSVFMGYFDKYLDIWNNQGFAAIREMWLKKAYKLNNIIIVNDGNNRITGVFNDIDLVGNIRIKTASGQLCALSVGELFFKDNAV